MEKGLFGTGKSQYISSGRKKQPQQKKQKTQRINKPHNPPKNKTNQNTPPKNIKE